MEYYIKLKKRRKLKKWKKFFEILLTALGVVFLIGFFPWLPSSKEPVNTNPYNTAPFISVWNTSITSSGSSADNQVKLPLYAGGIYNFKVDWGDGNQGIINSYNQSKIYHTYATIGIYTINITGTIIGWSFNGVGDRLKLLKIEHWGCLQIGNGPNDMTNGDFEGCSNLNITATDILNLNLTHIMFYAFADSGITTVPNMNLWNVSQVTDMSGMFYDDSNFNQSIGNWDVSHVTDMDNMFWNASSFNQPIGNWNVSHITDMSDMFAGASDFNQSIRNWDVSDVTDMWDMFWNASSFNQPIENWDVSHVTYMVSMFAGASDFNQSIEDWDVSHVIDMAAMFSGAISFNQLLGNWNVSHVMYMDGMFEGVKLSTTNYDNLLISWSKLPLQTGVSFSAGNSTYSSGAAASARSILTGTFYWQISDGGLAS